MIWSEKLSRREFLGGGLRLGAAGLAMPFAAAVWSAEEPDEKKKERWQIGCYTRPWDKYDYRVALDAIAEAGFKYAGLMPAKSKHTLVISVSTTPEEAATVAEEV